MSITRSLNAVIHKQLDTGMTRKSERRKSSRRESRNRRNSDDRKRGPALAPSGLADRLPQRETVGASLDALLLDSRILLSPPPLPFIPACSVSDFNLHATITSNCDLHHGVTQGSSTKQQQQQPEPEPEQRSSQSPEHPGVLSRSGLRFRLSSLPLRPAATARTAESKHGLGSSAHK